MKKEENKSEYKKQKNGCVCKCKLHTYHTPCKKHTNAGCIICCVRYFSPEHCVTKTGCVHYCVHREKPAATSFSLLSDRYSRTMYSAKRGGSHDHPLIHSPTHVLLRQLIKILTSSTGSADTLHCNVQLLRFALWDHRLYPDNCTSRKHQYTTSRLLYYPQ